MQEEKIRKHPKICLIPVSNHHEIDLFHKVWFKIKAFLDDDKNMKLSMIKEHESTDNGTCKDTSKSLPTYTRTINRLTEKMLKEKYAKQSELIKMIKEVQSQTDKKLKELLINDERSEAHFCQNCSKAM